MKTVVLPNGLQVGSMVAAESYIFGRHVLVHGKVLGKAPGRPWNGPRILLDLGPNALGTRVTIATGDTWRLLPEVADVVTRGDTITDWDLGIKYIEAKRGWPRAFDAKIEALARTSPWSLLAKSGANWRAPMIAFRDQMEKNEFHDPIYAERWDELVTYLGGLDYLAKVGQATT